MDTFTQCCNGMSSCAPAIACVTRLRQVAVAEQHRVLLLVRFDARRHRRQHIGAVVVVGDSCMKLVNMNMALSAGLICSSMQVYRSAA